MNQPNHTRPHRQGWAQLDELRKKLEDLKELRDLVRSLGRGGGWGPLRRAPVQKLDMSGRPGLLRTVLEAQETRGLTRSGDISRLLPAESAILARGRTVRQSKLLFYARLAEKGLQTYERDGWGEFPTQIHSQRREIRPTADRGPILLCVDTSGSMRGARETVAKALALECMRAAREQERDCYVFAFSGPAEVRGSVCGGGGCLLVTQCLVAVVGWLLPGGVFQGGGVSLTLCFFKPPSPLAGPTAGCTPHPNRPTAPLTPPPPPPGA